MIERVTRDTERKLGWNDRLVGTMRMALKQQITPSRYALGAAAALARLVPATLEGQALARSVLDALWREASPDLTERDRLVTLILTALGIYAPGRRPAFQTWKPISESLPRKALLKDGDNGFLNFFDLRKTNFSNPSRMAVF